MGDEVQVWRADLDVEETALAALSASLSAQEHVRAARFHFARDRRRWIAARGLLRAALGRILAVPPKSLLFETGSFGKPRLQAQSQAHPLRFNLSHTHNLMVMAFAWEREVGVDAEPWRDDFSPLELASQVFSSAELRFLRSVPAEEQSRAFLSVWTGKEAYVKASGEGLSFPLSQLTLLPPAPGNAWFVQDETAGPTRPAFQVYSLDADSDCCAALAVKDAVHSPGGKTTIQETIFAL